MLQNPGSSHIPVVSFSKFKGRIVACAFNLNQCGPGKVLKPDAACWTVRLAPDDIEDVDDAVAYFARKGASVPVAAYTKGVLLKDVGFSIQESGLRRVQREGKKDVFAFAVGTAAAGTQSVPQKWHAVKFSPLLPPKGRGERVFSADGKTLTRAAWLFGEERKAVVGGTLRQNPGLQRASLSDLQRLLADAPDLLE